MAHVLQDARYQNLTKRLVRGCSKRPLAHAMMLLGCAHADLSFADPIFFPQHDAKSSLFIAQEGNDNQVGSDVYAFEQSSHSGHRLHATITQVGDDNLVLGRQSGHQSAIIEQGEQDEVAINNRLFVTQTGATAVDSTPNTLEVEMAGNGNGASAIEIDGQPELNKYSWLMSDGGGVAGQHGEGNSMELDIEGENNAFVIYQGSDKTGVDQLGVYSTNNVMDVDLEGNDNRVVAYQGLDSNRNQIELEGDRNTITAGQFGIGNEISLMAQGDDNRIMVDQGMALGQTGTDYNIVSISVTGWNNQISLQQQGSFNSAYLTQVGNNNSIFVRQTSTGR